MNPATSPSLTASLGSKLTAATCPASFGVGSFIPHSLHSVIEPMRETSCAHNLTDNSGERARAFSNISARVADCQRQVDALEPRNGRPAKAGYIAKLERLRIARTALLKAENELNR